MRKVALGMMATLDGYIAGPKGELDWVFTHLDAEIESHVAGVLGEIDTYLIGRANYEEQAAHWPHQTGPVADLMNGTDKVVFSSTLDTVGWSHARLASGTPAEEIARLKEQAGGTIGVPGGASFAQHLTAQGLIDEYSLTVLPVVLGSGIRLFTERLDLALVRTKTFTSGAVNLVYRPV